MKKLLIGLVLLVILLIAAVAIIPSLVPSSVYKDRIQSQLSQELGRPVTLSGDVKLSTFPVLKASTDGVNIANAEGFTAANLASIEGLSARIKLLPLLSKRVEISSFTLNRPVINLEKNADGRVNWAFNEEVQAVETEEKGPFRRDGRFTQIDPEITALNIAGGEVRYSDASSGQSYTATNINTFLALPGLRETLVIDGSLTFDEEPITLDITMDSVGAFLDGQAAQIKGLIATDFAKVNVDGAFLASQALDFDAQLSGNISDLAALKPYLKDQADKLDIINTAEFSGRVARRGEDITLTGSKLDADGENITLAFAGDAKYAQTLSADGKIDADIRNVAAFRSFLPDDIQGLDQVKSAKLSADLSATDTGFKANNIDASAQGPNMTASYKGTADYGDILKANGVVTAKSANPNALAAAFMTDAKPLPALGETDLRAQISLNDKSVDAKEIALTSAGADYALTYQGAGSFKNETPAAAGTFTLRADNIENFAKAAGQTIPELALLGKVDASGDIAVNGSAINAKTLTAKLSDGLVNGSYTGAVAYDEAAKIDGRFDGQITDLAAVDAALAREIPYSNILGRVDVAGQISGQDKTFALNGATAKVQSAYLSGEYTGDLTLAETPRLSGAFSAQVPSVSALNAQVPQDIPYADALGKVAFRGRLDGAADNLQISDIQADLTEGNLTGRYTGNARYASGAASLSGDLTANIDSLRKLAAIGGTQLPPSTAAGPIFEAAAISGQISGSPSEAKLSGASLAFDGIKGTGDFVIRTSGAKPKLTGALALDGLDLRPYVESYSAQAPEGAIQPWSTAPINTAPLRAMDADVKLQTPFVKTGRVDLGATRMDVTLSNGQLAANIPALALYGGNGAMSLGLDGRAEVPQISMDINVDSLNSQSFLGAVAGFTKASGTAGTAFKIRGSGRTQAEIMQSLDGAGDFKLTDGQIQGIDTAKFLTGVESALTSRSLPQGLGSGQITQFKNLLGNVTINNGVASIGNFELGAANLSATGMGTIDLGNQTIDFRFRPKVVGTDAGRLSGFGIPLRMSGKFGAVNAGLDSDFLGQIVAARAQAAVQDKLQKEIGGVLGGVLGGGNTQAPTTDGTQATPSTQDAIGDVLGGLLGTKKAAPQPAPAPALAPVQTPAPNAETPPAPAPEAKPEEQLLDLIFGGKKKKDEGGN